MAPDELDMQAAAKLQMATRIAQKPMHMDLMRYKTKEEKDTGIIKVLHTPK